MRLSMEPGSPLTRTSRLPILVAALAIATATDASAQPQMVPFDPPPEMAQLDFLIGTWTGEGEILDAAGNVTQRIGSAECGWLRIEPALNGQILEAGAGSDLARTWYTYRPLEKVFVWVAVDAQSHFDHLRGGFVDGELVLTEIAPHPWPDGGTMMFRRTYRKIQADSHEVLMEISRDEGDTWILYSRQLEKRAQPC